MTSSSVFEEYRDAARSLLHSSARAEGRSAPRAFVRTFGCQQNEADSERLKGALAALGCEISAEPEGADVILVNTCAIREHAENKALSVIGQFKHLKAAHPATVLGICGCMTAEPHRREQFKRSFPYVDFTLPPASESLLPKLICEAFADKRAFIEEAVLQTESVRPYRADPVKAWVSVMYGCNNFCSYCIVPYVRGRERSRPAEDVEREVGELVASGCKDITLLGQNVNSYHGGCDFAALLDRLCGIEGDFLLRFMTSHPKDATSELIDVIARQKKIARHFHLPLQSGSDRILARMNRKYDRARYLSLVHALREKIPEIAITTDIIVGFPGETEEDFEDTLDLLRTVRFDMIYAFIYSPRKGTPAAKMEDQIPREVQNARFDRLLALQNAVSEEINSASVGRSFRVLSEGPSKTDPAVLAGRTESGKLVLFEGSAPRGVFTQVRITAAEPYALRGTEE